MRIGCNNVKIKYLLLQRLRIVVTQILVATMNGICYNWQIFGRDLFDESVGGTVASPRTATQSLASGAI